MVPPLDLETAPTPVMTTPPPDGGGTPVTPRVDGEPEVAPQEPEVVPDQIGRFRVLKRLGSGGMGVVYVAYDEELGRKVALKVLRTTATTPAKRDKARHRLQREAQAMAKLSHPNVIAIFDVGAVVDQVFLAMEYVKGATLTKWLRTADGPQGPRRRTWQEVLVVFVQAGRGLAAAHQAGIIHRDFKPDNVLIDAEGRVRVGDFGLARAEGGLGPLARPDTFTEAIKSMSDKSMLDIRITRTGGMTGTPAYMAPEQYLGQATDARTDQFSFCVALYEGLYGQRPFLGERVAVVREAVLAGRVQDVPRENEVPAWLRKIVLRGLSVRPADRFRSMEELLLHLTEAPRPRIRRRHLLVAGGVVLALAVAAFGVHDYLSAQPAAPLAELRCDPPEVPWDDAHRRALGRALGERPGGDTFGPAALAALDAYADGLRDMYQGTCPQGPVDAAPREGLVAQKSACLERRRGAFVGLVRALADVGGPALDRALMAAEDLPPLRECDDPRRLLAEPAPPEGPDARAQAQRLRESFAHADAVLALGDATRAWDIAQSVVAAAQQQDHLPLRAEALRVRGAIERALGRVGAAATALEEALWAAEASRHDPVVVDALTLLLDLESEDLGRRGEARRLWARLSATLRRLGDEGPREIAAYAHYGRALLREGDVDAAREQLGEALRRVEAAFGPDDRRLVPVLLDLVLACHKAGRGGEASQQLARADLIAGVALPPDHPERLRVLVVSGDLARERGDLPAARARYDRAIEAHARLHGHDHPDMSSALLGRGLAYAGEQAWAAAAADLRRALAASEGVFGPEHPRLLEPLIALCAVDSAMNEHASAQIACRRAIAVALRLDNAAQVSVARFALARAIWAEAQSRGEVADDARAQALAVAQQALDEGQGVIGPQLSAAISAWIAGRR